MKRVSWIGIILFSLVMTLGFKSSFVSAKKNWDISNIYSIAENGYTYHALFTSDEKEAWIVKVEVTEGTKKLIIPKILNNAKVTAIGYSYNGERDYDIVGINMDGGYYYDKLFALLKKQFGYSMHNNLLGQVAKYDNDYYDDRAYDFSKIKNDITEIELPDTIDKVYQGCFAGFTSLKKMVFPPNVKSVEDYTFGNCSKLEHVTLPAKMESYAYNVFRQCPKMKKIYLSNSNSKYLLRNDFLIDKKDMSVAEMPFSGTNLKVPNGVKYLSGKASPYLKAKSIFIPSSVKSIWKSALQCKTLKAITVDRKNKTFAVDQNNLYKKKNKELYAVVAKNKKIVISKKIKRLPGKKSFVVALGKYNTVYYPSSLRKFEMNLKPEEEYALDLLNNKLILTGKNPSKSVVKKIYKSMGKVYVEKKYLKEYKNLFTKKEKGISKRKIVGA